MAAASKPRVLIAGAGIGGLTAALALIRRGFAVEIYEQTSALREVGAGVLVSPNGMLVLRELGLADRAFALSGRPRRREIRLWNTGHAWPTFEFDAATLAEYGRPFAWLYRPDLLELLAQAVAAAAPDAIRLGKKVSGGGPTADGAVLCFADGSEAQGDALIGADGVHSVLRTSLHGADAATLTGFVAWRAVIPFGSLPSHLADDVAKTWLGPNGHFVEYPVRRSELLNIVGVVERSDWQTESWSAIGTPGQMAHDFRGWHDNIQAIIQAIPEPGIWALLIRRPLATWSQGAVTLLGDAAHPTLPFLGQGATMAIEDGFVLARALEAHRDDLAAGCQSYEAARGERTSRLVTGAAENAQRLTNPILSDPAAAHAYLDREYSQPTMRNRLDWIYQYDATRVPV
ncbi:MAG TPA: FAD-dependent monooxygenase [Acetobacteraceae bacterium]|nr:FAD-dependent monooxygenase [Acetobacteraceae bacterium]